MLLYLLNGMSYAFWLSDVFLWCSPRLMMIDFTSCFEFTPSELLARVNSKTNCPTAQMPNCPSINAMTAHIIVFRWYHCILIHIYDIFLYDYSIHSFHSTLSSNTALYNTLIEFVLPPVWAHEENDRNRMNLSGHDRYIRKPQRCHWFVGVRRYTIDSTNQNYCIYVKFLTPDCCSVCTQ